MAEYIEREVVMRELRDVYEREFPTADGAFDLFANRIVPRVIKNIPTAEVEPVRHGHWIDCDNDAESMSLLLAQAPTVDAVEVCYCKDCQHCREYSPQKGFGYCYHWSGDQGLSLPEVEGNDFCSYGERKEG